MNLVPNEKRAFEVFSILEKAWIEKTGVFSDIVLPEAKLLDNINAGVIKFSNEELARILFAAAIFMRGGIVSEDPLKMFPYLLENFPEMFNPEKIQKEWSQERIGAAIKEASEKSFSGDLLKKRDYSHPTFLSEMNFVPTPKKHSKKEMVLRRAKTSSEAKTIYKVDEFAKGWKINFDLVAKEFNGKVLNIYKNIKEFEQLFTSIGKEIFGMRRKILSLLTIWMQELKIIPMFPCPLPVDFHALRIMFATGIFSMESFLKFNENYPSHAGKLGTRIKDGYITEIMQWSQRFMTRQNFAHQYINPALWVVSRELCAFNHQNKSLDNATRLIDSHTLKNNVAWPEKYAHPCLACPIAGFCNFSIPSGPYYRTGLLIINGERIPYPVDHLPGMDLTTMPMKQKRNNRS